MKNFIAVSISVTISLSVAAFSLFGLVSAAQADDLVCLYRLPDYQGAKFCFRPGQRPPDLDAFPMSDGTYTDGKFGSIQVKGAAAATVYDSPDYGAMYTQPMFITASIPYLPAVWGGTILSLDVVYP